MAQDMKNTLCYSTMQEYILTTNDAELQCLKALHYGIGSVAVLPTSLVYTDNYLKGTDVKIKVGISYPSGAYYPDIKSGEIKLLLNKGYHVDEFIVVLAVGHYKSGYKDMLVEEIEECIKAAAGIPVSFVLEAAVLDDGQLKEICDVCKEKGAKAIVSSANFAPYGIKLPTAADVKRLVAAAGELPVYAFASVKDKKEYEELAATGAAEIIVDNIENIL